MARKRAKRCPPKTAAEIGVIRKRWGSQLKVALVYPNTYHVGMSNLGFQTVYGQLNRIPQVLCERAFLPAGDDEHTPLITCESRKPLKSFDIVAFSVSFENDYPNILKILALAGLPLKAADRLPPLPLVMAGGAACLLNPEPVADFIDCFFVGEAETMLARLAELYDPSAERDTNLKILAQNIEGIYVPAFYQVSYHEDGTLASFKPCADVPAKIVRTFLADLAQSVTCSAILSPYTTFAKTYLIETSRGCPHGCRFCAAGYMYRPPRFRPQSGIFAAIECGAALTDRIGLVGAAVSDLPQMPALCTQIAETYTDPKTRPQFSFSSLRADALTPELLDLLKESRVKTVALAPDAGSERMRRVINKGLDEETILSAAERLVLAGIPNLKLYFMIGLPTETAADVQEIPGLVKRLKHHFLKSSRVRKKIGEITVSVNAFVPKPVTPFQWAAMAEIPELKEKIRTIKEGLRRVANVRVHADIPRWAYIQGLLARGDRRVGRILAQVHQNGGNWAQALKNSPLNADFYVLRERPTEELLPWEFIDHRISRAFLAQEYKCALAAKPSPPCPIENCTRCGVCGERP